MGVGSNPTSDKNSFDSQKLFCQKFDHKYWTLLYMLNHSRVAQWKRAGPITQRSVDRNYALLRKYFPLRIKLLILIFIDQIVSKCCIVPLAQRIARWTSNPKVLGSIPRWDAKEFLSFFAPLSITLISKPTIVPSQNGRVV